MKKLAFLCCVLFLLAACASPPGPVVTTVTGVFAAMLAALDSLLKSGVLTPEQYLPMATAVKGMADTFATTTHTVAEVKSQVDAVGAKQWTPTEVGGVATTAIAAAAAIATKVSNVIRDSHYTPEELAERKIKRIKVRAAKKAK